MPTPAMPDPATPAHSPPVAPARTDHISAGLADLLAVVDAVVESAVLGMRKPEEAFYRVALDALAVRPSQVVFLDDLGVNLKPARAMGMATIKVEDPWAALAELHGVLQARPRPA